MRWVWNVLIFLGAAAIGFGVVDDRSAVILVGALLVVGAGIGRENASPDRDRRPVVWPRVLLATVVLAVLGAVLGIFDAPAWLTLILFAAVGAAGCTRPVDKWIHEGRTA